MTRRTAARPRWRAVRLQPLQINWTHSFAGAVYYGIGRTNNLGVGESLLLSAFAALYWEPVVEWREVFSVNDTTVTVSAPSRPASPSISSRTISLTRQNPVSRVLGFIHPLIGLHAVLDPASPPAPPRADAPRLRGLPRAGRRDHRLTVCLRHRHLYRASGCVRGSPSPRGMPRRGRSAGRGGRCSRAPPISTWTLTAGWSGSSTSSAGRSSTVGSSARGGLPGGRLHPRPGLRVHPLSQGAGARLRCVGVVPLGLRHPGGPGTPATSTRSFTSSGRCTRVTGAARGGGSPGGWRPTRTSRLVNAYALNEYAADHDISGMKSTHVVLRLLLRVRGQPSRRASRPGSARSPSARRRP